MTWDNRRVERIRGYVQGTLSEEERRLFEAELKQDESLYEDTLLEQRLYWALKNEEKLAFAKHLKERMAAGGSSSPPNGWKWWIWGLAAVTFAAAWWRVSVSTTPPTDFQSFLFPYQHSYVTLHTQDQPNNLPTPCLQGLQAYDKGDYGIAAELLGKCGAVQPEPELVLVEAVAWLLEQEYEKSIDLFLRVKTKEEAVLLANHFYLGLAYAANRTPEKARFHLLQIAKEDSKKDLKTAQTTHDYSVCAFFLLEKIGKMGENNF